MHRNFFRGLLIVLVPTLLLGAFAVFGQYRPGIDLAGGTILVYELDTAKLEKDKKDPNAPDASEGLDSEQMQQLAESLKRRIDPVDTKNIIIRPVGSNRVEIVLPFVPKKGGKAESAVTEDDVQFVKDIVAQVGVLEFRILANQIDDAEAIRDAEARITALTPEEAEKLARAGAEPPALAGDYRVVINDDPVDGVRYEWKELGRDERQSLGLNNAAALGDNPSGLASALAARRGKTYLHQFGGDDEGKNKTLSMLLFSRDFKKENPAADEDGKKVEYYVLTRVSPKDSIKVGDNNTITAQAENPRGNWVVGFRFTSGAAPFTQMTERNRPTGTTYRSMAILLDGKVVSAPSLNERLDGGGQISGSTMTKKNIDRLVYILRSGALTAGLKPNPVSENTIGPTLGVDTRTKGLWSVGLAFIVVLAFMVYYYRFAGLVASIALLLNLLMTIGFMNAVSAAYTLAGLAGIVLMLGMAVDANVLIYERLREERSRGASLTAALRAGYDRALPTIIDTHLTSIFTSIVLYTFGNDNLKGFAVSLTVGLIISLFTATYVTRLIFDFAQAKGVLKDLKMMALFSRPNIDFMAIRKPMFALTGGLTVLGLALFLFRGEKGLNVDFRGGTAYGGRLAEPLNLAGFHNLLSETNQKTRLVVREVAPIRPPQGDDAAATHAATRTYNIYYEGSPEPVAVTLASDPAGPGQPEAEQLARLRERASHLPDVSVEQVYLGGESVPNDGCKSFTLRTTEGESDLVQAILDRLLRDPTTNAPLIGSTKMSVGPIQGATVELSFSEPTSRFYVIGLLNREFRIAFREPAVGKAFELTGITEGDDEARKKQASSGKFLKMLVDVSKNPEFKSLTEADPAKAAADRTALEKLLAGAKTTFEGRPTPERLETFDATLAQDTRTKAFYAILASWTAILLYLWFRFGNWTFGLAAVLCLIHDLCFTLGAISFCHYIHDTWFGQIIGLQDFKIDLATVAALLTLVGYSVNEIIVNFARLREVRGKNPLLTPAMINQSVNQTLSRTILTSTTVFLVSFVLYVFGGDGVHLFGFVMATGVLISTYSSIYIASPLLLILGEGKAKADPKKPAPELAKVP